MENQKGSKIFVGLDIGTDSVGYAVTDDEYRLLKHGGEPMWGSHTFDGAAGGEERRSYRTARRRLERKKQRIKWVREIFADLIAQKDEQFFKRLDMSARYLEDKQLPSKNSFFNDKDYTDKNYHHDYPTIHHLICELAESSEEHDVRLVYLAISWLVAHRGHFLNEADKDNVAEALDFKRVYSGFLDCFEVPPWQCNEEKLKGILLKKSGVKAKEKELLALLFGGKKPVSEEDDAYDPATLVNLLAGGKVKPAELFLNKGYTEIKSFTLKDSEEALLEILSELSDSDRALLEASKKLSDWSLLSLLVGEAKSISEAKVEVYNQHQRDLKNLKAFVKKYFPKQEGKHGLYDEIFLLPGEHNYVAYSYNLKGIKKASDIKEKATAKDFCDYLSKKLKGVSCEEEDKAFYEDMMYRLSKENHSFCPKQVEGDNRLIPYQLYYSELVAILEHAAVYLPFLSEPDSEGITPADKLKSIFLFRIPYFVGPLNPASENAWIKRSAEKIYPWSFEKTVDLNASEQEFIKRMTCSCTYLPGEKVLPKNSLIYSKYTVLNEINNIKINGIPLEPQYKQGIYDNLFCKFKRVTVKQIKDYLSHFFGKEGLENLSGLDIRINVSLKSYHVFKRLLDSGTLKHAEVEEIIESMAYSEDKTRLKKYLKEKYPQLLPEDIKYIASQNLKEFGRLSRRLLEGVYFTDTKTGEMMNVMQALWEGEDNLMQLLSDKYTLKERLDSEVKEYYECNPVSLGKWLEEMYVPSAVRRPIIRTLDILKDIKKTCGAPDKIFIEMARGADENQKNTRTVSRKEKLKEFLASVDEDVSRLLNQLEELDDRRLQKDALYLYFLQLGKCMYTGEPIEITELSSRYNIDHIYPQRFIKDDSLENRVLVKSEENGRKGDSYPISGEIRSRMLPYWKKLKASGLIGDKKYSRLTRETSFSEEEKYQFINRQLVETRQSTKAVAKLIKDIYPECEVVYVKAGLVSEFRQEFGMLKSRSVNDLHHAKDAYLNIAVGNVYNSVFTKNFNVNSDYSVKVKTLFKYERYCGKTAVWQGEASIAEVKRVVNKNNIHLTRYQLTAHGGLFDQNPVKASSGNLIPLKSGLDPQKYGGYNKPTAAFFSLVRYTKGKKKELTILAVDLLIADKFLSSKAFAEEYARQKLGEKACDIEFPLGDRVLKINTVLSIDGFKAFISGKGSGGKRIILSSITPLVLGAEWESYVKRLESFEKKFKAKRIFQIDEENDKITREQNKEFYELYIKKAELPIFNLLLTKNIVLTLQKGKENFDALSIEKQALALLKIGEVFKTGRKGACDMSYLKCGENEGSLEGSLYISANLSNAKKQFKDMRIIDSSASGIYEKQSQNLLELL